MYQLTYIDASNELQVVTSPVYGAIEGLYFALPRSMHPRFWRVQSGLTALLA